MLRSGEPKIDEENDEKNEIQIGKILNVMISCIVFQSNQNEIQNQRGGGL